MNYIKYNMLRIKSSNLQKTINFYANICGMNYERKIVDLKSFPYSWSDDSIHVFRYDNKRDKNELTAACFIVDDDNFQSSYKDSGYWKIGLSLKDVNAAVDYFGSNHINISPGQQFYDVGFLTSFCDPNGYSIELLQHNFENNFKKPENSDGILLQPLDIPPSIGQITIRCTDIEKTKDFYVNVLGMKLLCIEQPANTFPFTLYFFAYTNDEPPSQNLTNIANREWLYEKTYCQIEVQFRHNLTNNFSYITNDSSGCSKISHVGFSVQVQTALFDRIRSNEQVCKIPTETSSNGSCFIKDPDGFIIHVTV